MISISQTICKLIEATLFTVENIEETMKKRRKQWLRFLYHMLYHCVFLSRSPCKMLSSFNIINIINVLAFFQEKHCGVLDGILRFILLYSCVFCQLLRSLLIQPSTTFIQVNKYIDISLCWVLPTNRLVLGIAAVEI